MYYIDNLDKTTGDMTFKVFAEGSQIEVIININKKHFPDFSDYRGVPNNAYIRQDTGNVELVTTNTFRAVPPPSLYQTIDGEEVQYIIANQYNFDKWCKKIYQDCDNSKIFTLLDGLTKNKIETMC